MAKIRYSGRVFYFNDTPCKDLHEAFEMARKFLRK